MSAILSLLFERVDHFLANQLVLLDDRGKSRVGEPAAGPLGPDRIGEIELDPLVELVGAAVFRHRRDFAGIRAPIHRLGPDRRAVIRLVVDQRLEGLHRPVVLVGPHVVLPGPDAGERRERVVGEPLPQFLEHPRCLEELWIRPLVEPQHLRLRSVDGVLPERVGLVLEDLSLLLEIVAEP